MVIFLRFIWTNLQVSGVSDHLSTLVVSLIDQQIRTFEVLSRIFSARNPWFEPDWPTSQMVQRIQLSTDLLFESQATIEWNRSKGVRYQALRGKVSWLDPTGQSVIWRLSSTGLACGKQERASSLHTLVQDPSKAHNPRTLYFVTFNQGPVEWIIRHFVSFPSNLQFPAKFYLKGLNVVIHL